MKENQRKQIDSERLKIQEWTKVHQLYVTKENMDCNLSYQTSQELRTKGIN